MERLLMSVANPRNTSTFAVIMVRALVLVFIWMSGSVSSRAWAQTGPSAPPPKPRSDDHGGKHFGPGSPDQRGGPDHRGGPDQRFGFPGGGGSDALSEEEKKQLRVAVEKVWNDAEIIAAREKIMKANEDLRTALRTALQKKDPEVVKILEKVKNVMPWDQHRGPPRLPRPEDPNFPRMAAARLGMEMMFMAKPEQRDAFRHLHERIVELPAVREAIAKIETVPVEGRMEAFKALRDIYKKECERAISEYREKKQKEGEGPAEAPRKN